MVAPDARVAQAAELYAATFAGRLDVYSFWTGDHWKAAGIPPKDGHPAVWRPLTPDVVINAFRTGIPISGYVLAPDSTTHIAMLDIDRAYGMKLGLDALHVIQHMGGVAYLEPSSRGCHLWIVLEQARPAIFVRRALRGLISAAKMPPCPGSGRRPVLNERQKLVCAGCPQSADDEHAMPEHDDPKIELRPGSDRLAGPDSLGHCIRMPTMPHHRTGKRFGLIAQDGTLLPEKLVDMMLEIDTCPLGPLEDLAEMAPLPKLPSSPPLDLRFPFGAPQVDRGAAEILRDLWGMPQPKIGRANICPAHDDHRPSLSIARDDQRVWCKNGGCVLYNDGRGRGTHELTALAPKRS